MLVIERHFQRGSSMTFLETHIFLHKKIANYGKLEARSMLRVSG